MDVPSTRDELVRLLEAAYKRFEQTLDRFSDAQTTAANIVGVWSPKDVLAHMLYWQRLPVHELNAALRGERYPEDGSNADEMNAKSVAANQNVSWNALREDFRRAHREVIDAVKSLPDAAFEPGSAVEQALNDTVVDALAGNTYDHYDVHETQLRAWLDTQ